MPVHSSTNVDTFGAPGQVGGVTLGMNLDRTAADIDRIAIDLDHAGKAAMHGIRSGKDVAFVSTGPRSLIETTSMSVRPDSMMARRMFRPMRPKTVDGDFDGHVFPLTACSSAGRRGDR